RCHRKKVRCDTGQPSCLRCQSTNAHCSYPSSRRSRNTQPHHVDPYIENLSVLEHQIRQIETDMNDYKSRLFSTLSTLPSKPSRETNASDSPLQKEQDRLRSSLHQSEQDVQESRTILAQLRLRGEQQIARSKRNQAKEAKKQRQASGDKKQPQTRRPMYKAGKAYTSNATATAATPVPQMLVDPGHGSYFDQASFFPSTHVPTSAIGTETMVDLMMYPPRTPLPSAARAMSASSSSTSLYPQDRQHSPDTAFMYNQSYPQDDVYLPMTMAQELPPTHDALLQYPWTTPQNFAEKSDPIDDFAAVPLEEPSFASTSAFPYETSQDGSHFFMERLA
ncbi:hypothetical protein DM01DRAFT_1396254, partial [Hesseltinella vesiculosa]